MSNLTIFVTYNSANKIYKSSDSVFKYFDVDKNEVTSKLNAYFSEVSTIYWANKNVKSNYYGFFQYRRYLSFNNKRKKYPASEKGPNEIVFKKYNLNAEKITSIVSKYDVVVPYKKNLIISNGLFSNMYRQYKHCYNHNIKDLDYAIEIIHDMHPEFDKYVNRAMRAKKIYCYNIFIMKKTYFDGYCNWLFPILFKLHENKNYTNSSAYNKRSIGFIAERLFNVYMQYLIDINKDIKIYETQLVVIGSDKPLNIGKSNKVKSLIPESTKLGRMIRCIFHTIRLK